MTNQNIYDERINYACGKIYARGILYATLVALCYGILHFWSLTTTYHYYPHLLSVGSFSRFYVFFLPEASIFLGGWIILLVGRLLHGKARDEREISAKHNYYLGAVKAFVIIAFLGYAFTIPFSPARHPSDVPQNYLAMLFETLGVIYLYYALKKRLIFFNHSFIQERKRRYYGRVFLNIGKLSGILFLGFLAAGFLDLGRHGSFLHGEVLITAYLSSVLGLGLEYLFISWTEKLSHDEKEHRGLHLGTFVKFLFLLGYTLLAMGAAFLLIAVSNGLLSDALIQNGHHLGEILTELSELRNHYSHECSVLTAMVLCKFMCQIQDCKLGQKVIGGMVILTCVSLLWSYTSTFILSYIQTQGSETIIAYVKMTTVISLIETLINSLLWTLLIYDLVKTQGLSPLLWIVAGVRWLLTSMGATASFLGHQGFSVVYGIAGGILGFASLVLLLVLLHRHQYPHEHEEYVSINNN